MQQRAPLKSPSLSGLRALEAVVRTGSVKRAAEELAVSASAVSHQLSGLEKECGAPLFAREGRRLVPLPKALRVAESIGDAFWQLAKAHAGLTEETRERLVRVVAPTSFAIGWLFSSIQTFRKLHPDIELFLIPSDNPAGVQRNPAQVVIHHGSRPPGNGWQAIMRDVRVVLGTPEVVAAVTNAQDPSSVPLIRVRADGGSSDGLFTWEEWFAVRGIKPRHAFVGPYASQGHLALSMALRGEGLALAEIGLARAHVLSGALAELPGSATKTQASYWCNAKEADRADVAVFFDWLCTELHRDCAMRCPPLGGAQARPKGSGQ